MTVKIKYESPSQDEIVGLTHRTDYLNWYVLDEDSDLENDWRYLGSSVRYEFKTSMPDVLWLVTPNATSDTPAIPQFHMPCNVSDAATQVKICKFFESYALIHITFLKIHRDNNDWSEKVNPPTE